MKKLLFCVFVIAVALVLLAQQDLLWSRLQWLEAPRVHVVEKGESLSKLAKDNYGDTDYWRELALINRAPKPGHIQPGEEVLLPAASVIQELRRARTISRVNDLINEQQTMAKHATPANTQVETQPATAANEPSVQPATEQLADNSAPAASVITADPPRFDVDNSAPVFDTPVEDNSSSWFWLIFGLLALGGVVGFVVYRRRQEEEEALQRLEEKHKANGESRNFPTDRRPQSSSKMERATA